MVIQKGTLVLAGSSGMWTALSSSHPPLEQRSFQFYNGKMVRPMVKSTTFFQPLSIGLIEEMSDFETSSFVQLVFALAIPDLFSYSISFPSVFIHTIKIIEKYSQEISRCISHADFNYSSVVRKTIPDSQLMMRLNRALNDVIFEYGGLKYRLERGEHIRKECLRQDVSDSIRRFLGVDRRTRTFN